MAGSILVSATIGVLALAGQSAAQTAEYTDSNTGITFQQIVKNDNAYTFGLALPATFGKDFIGQITGKGTAGWAGVSFGGEMTNSLLFVAYPSGENVTASLRQATEYASPPLYKGDAVLKPIPTGTFANSDGFSYTFLCQNCVVDGLTFDGSDPDPTLGWVQSTNAVDDPTSPSSVLNYHDNLGEFGADIKAAASDKFADWAAMAVDAPTTPTPPGGGNGTFPDAPVRNVTYDYIIAGAGAGGIVAAERIAESGASVLLLERGEASLYASGGNVTMPWNDTVTIFDVPALRSFIPTTPGANAFCPDTAAKAGCVLGGGTAVNGMIFVRPNKRDFDDFPEGWKFDDVADAAERLYERNPHTLYPSLDGKYYDGAVFDMAAKSFESNGWTNIDAIANPDEKHMMFSRPPCGIVNGLRGGPVRTYLPLAKALDNFKLELNTKVIRAVRTNSTITGVEVEVNGARETININPGGKVILAAGSMSTPRILFNSGIGPAEQIETVASGNTLVRLPEKSAWIDLPVGKRIQDHPMWHTNWTITGDAALQPIVSSDTLNNPPADMVDEFARGVGVLPQNDVRMEMWTDITPAADNITRWVQVEFSSMETGTFSMVVFLTHGATSRGELGITADGATTYVQNPLMHTDGDKEAVSTLVETLLAYSRQPGAAFAWPGSANATAADVLQDMQSGIHIVASAPIGTDDGRQAGGNAVVDLDTRVYGTDNLFIVDASINPSVPTGNTMAITMLVAEKAVEKILAFQPGPPAGPSQVKRRAAPPHGQQHYHRHLHIRAPRDVPGRKPPRPALLQGRVVVDSA